MALAATERDPATVPPTPVVAPGGAHVETTALTDLRVHVRLRVAEGGGGCVILTGPPRSGLTYAGARIAESHQAAWLTVPPTMTAAQSRDLIYEAITGAPSPRGRAADLELRCAVAAPQLLIIDRAHSLSLTALQELAFLLELPASKLSLLLIGLEELRARAAGLSLETRGVHQRLDAHTGTPLLDTVRALHPLLARASDAQIKRVDKRYAHGLLGRWADFLRRADALRRHSDLTELDDLIALVIAHP